MDDGTKTKLQTRHLTSSIKETDGMVQDEYPNTKVGKSKFAEMRPQHVLLSNKLPHNMCLCKSHVNLIAAIDALHKAIPDFPIHYQRPFSVTRPLRTAGSGHVTCGRGQGSPQSMHMNTCHLIRCTGHTNTVACEI